jgi:hypothetical protein
LVGWIRTILLHGLTGPIYEVLKLNVKSGKSFKQHVKEKVSAALSAMYDIENLRLPSLETAMKLKWLSSYSPP